VESYSSNIPNKYYLSNNYPNPFNPSTTIRFGLPEQSEVTLSIYNILGQKVLEVREKSLAAGEHLYNFDASRLSSGVYIYSIHAVGANGKNFVSSKKMMLLK
ncbi:MAG: T9SS type A sorting domain-containing protein, partial [Ignavibacteriaceae bacterium]